MSVVTAVESELDELRMGESVLGASALAMARMLDDDGTTGAARASAARELRETMAVLVALASAVDTDRMTEFEQRLAVRRAAQG